MKAVILAGGKGTRLKPYTIVFPKPLMPVGDKPILEIIIEQLKNYGLTDIIISVGYLGELITNYFGNGQRFGANISYIKEDRPLGTAGGLSLLNCELKDTFLMVNGDTLTSLNFSEFITYHKQRQAIATIALKNRSTYVDFGVIELDKTDSIEKYIEKPTFNHLVSMGVYAFEPRVLQYLNPGERVDLPDFIKLMISKDEIVKGYTFDGYWLDIGRPDDYEKANSEIEELNKMLKLVKQ